MVKKSEFQIILKNIKDKLVFFISLNVLVLFLFGGPSLSGFSFALLIGIIVGTYSSIFVATPVFVDLIKR